MLFVSGVGVGIGSGDGSGVGACAAGSEETAGAGALPPDVKAHTATTMDARAMIANKIMMILRLSKPFFCFPGSECFPVVNTPPI